MVGHRRTWRRVVLLGVPSLYILLGLLHPMANPELGDETDLFIWLHIAQLFLIVGLGYVLWLLVEGVTNRAATLARALIIPFLVAYTALDAILGIAWGIAAETANDLPAADQQGAGRLIDELISGDPDPRGLILYWGAGLLWLAVALAVVAALTGHSPARRPRVDGTRRGSVHARTRPTDGSDRDGLVPPRHRVDRGLTVCWFRTSATDVSRHRRHLSQVIGDTAAGLDARPCRSPRRRPAWSSPPCSSTTRAPPRSPHATACTAPGSTSSRPATRPRARRRWSPGHDAPRPPLPPCPPWWSTSSCGSARS